MLKSDEQHETAKRDFFISCAVQDKRWGEWLADQLETRGYTVVVPWWDFRPGMNEIWELHKALTMTERTIAVLSPYYIAVLSTLPDWTTTFKRDATGELQHFLPVLVQDCELEGLLQARIPINLTNLDQEVAVRTLLESIAGERLKPKTAPRYPGNKSNIFGLLKERNLLFVGREDILKNIYRLLHKGNSIALVPAISVNNSKSIGKTEIALEYVYRNQCEYDTVVWIEDQPDATSSDTLFDHAKVVAEKLQVPQDTFQNLENLLHGIRDWLEQHTNWLLVLDSMRDLQVVQLLLSAQHHGHILVTCRARQIAALAQLIEIEDRPAEDKAISEKLAHLVHAALHSPTGEHIALNFKEATVGSAQDNTLCFQDASVAPHHAVIHLRNGAYELTSLNSSYETFINGQRISSHVSYPLHQKDLLQVGNVRLAYGSDTINLTPPIVQGDSTSPIFEHASALHVSEPSASHKYMQPLRRLEDQHEILERIRRSDIPDSWHVFRSKLPLSHLSVNDLESIRLAMITLGGFLGFGTALLVFLSLANSIGILFFALLIGEVICIGLFVRMMLLYIDKPIRPEMTYLKEALLVLTPTGFIEYLDQREENAESVAYADLTNMILCQDEEGMPWLDLSYRNGDRGQWNQRAYFGLPEIIVPKVLEQFINYTKQYNV
jgi:TIR domain/FHA domain